MRSAPGGRGTFQFQIFIQTPSPEIWSETISGGEEVLAGKWGGLFLSYLLGKTFRRRDRDQLFRSRKRDAAVCRAEMCYPFGRQHGRSWAVKRRDFITLLGGAVVFGCAILASAQTAAAQSFPARPLTLVVPFAAGGPSDVAGRIVAQGLSEKLGQQVIVENPAGAGGTLGSLRVAKAPPDGYQFVIGNSGTHAWSQALYKRPPYNTVTDFAPLGLIVEAPRAIIAPKNFPATTLPELVVFVKTNQSTVKDGSAVA